MMSIREKCANAQEMDWVLERKRSVDHNHSNTAIPLANARTRLSLPDFTLSIDLTRLDFTGMLT